MPGPPARSPNYLTTGLWRRFACGITRNITAPREYHFAKKAIRGGYQLEILQKTTMHNGGKHTRVFDSKLVLRASPRAVYEEKVWRGRRFTQLIIRAPLRKGAHWRSGKGRFEAHFTLLDLDRVVRTPAGTYRHCLVVLQRLKLLRTVTRSTYCPGQGLVKSISSGRTQARFTLTKGMNK